MIGNLHGLFFAAAVVAVMAFSAPVQAGLKTGNDLYRDCARDSEREPFCLGYIVSIIEATRVLGGHICLSSEVTVGQLRQVVTEYLAAHPETRDQEAAQETVRALNAAFPCRQ